MGTRGQRRLLVVDDEAIVRDALVRTLEGGGYVCRTAEDVVTARAALASESFDAILCDIQMPGESGLALLEEIATQRVDTAVLMVTGEDDPATARRAIAIGAYGYVVKPFTPNEIIINVMNAITRLDLERSRRLYEVELENKLLERSSSLGKAIKSVQDAESGETGPWAEIVDRLTRALTLRDEETGRHIERVGLYSELLAERHGLEGWSPADIRNASMLHDVGKIGIPDAILTKPQVLSSEEMLIVRRHCELGHELLTGSDARLLNLAASIALSHHEWWDGSGYPYGLTDDEIPIEGRIVAVADSFDAMTSDRVYRSALSLQEALTILREGRGTQFDPSLVGLLEDSVDEFIEIKRQHPDGDAPRARIRVIVVDDQQLFAEGLSRLIESTKDLTLVGVAGSVAGAVELALDEVPDVIVLDWRLPDGTGAEVARLVRAEHPSTRIVVLTGAVDDSLIGEAIDVGCSMVLTKVRAFEEIAAAIRSAFAGEVTISLSKLSSAVSRLPTPRDKLRSDLTPRELEILGLLGEGLSNEAIADSLTLSLHTVRNHVQRVIMKLNAHSKLEAVARGLRAGLIQIPPRFEAL